QLNSVLLFFFFSSRRRHTRFSRDWSSDVCSSDLVFSLDQALGVQDSYIETWKYAGDGIGFVVYSIVNNAGERTGGHIARIDLNEIGRASCRERMYNYGECV